MTSPVLEASWGEIAIGTRWRGAAGAIIEVVRVQRNGVVAFRAAGSPAGQDDESVLDVVRFIRAFAPASPSDAAAR